MNKSSQAYYDFEAVKDANTWHFKESDVIELSETRIQLSEEFQKCFPRLSKLISKARVSDVLINNQPYKLYSWTVGGERYSWLCIMEEVSAIKLEFIEEHQLILKEIGGITLFNTREDFNHLLDDQKLLFTASECSKGIDGWENFYKMLCDDNQIPEENRIKHENFVVFSKAYNGDVTCYVPSSKEVIQFKHDGVYTRTDDVYSNELIANQPEDTFYSIKGVKYFTDFVEVYAEGWLEFINSSYIAVKNLLKQKRLEDAILLTANVNDNNSRGELENLIGIEYFYLQNYEKALEFYVKAKNSKNHLPSYIDFNIWEVCEMLMNQDKDHVKWSKEYLHICPNGRYCDQAKLNL